MTDDERGELAGVLAHRALTATEDPLAGLMLLFHAASALCITRVSPAPLALTAYDRATAVARRRLVEFLSAQQAVN